MTRSYAEGGFVGRSAELAALSRSLRSAAEGHAAAVLVAGDAGVGKTRLTQELASGVQTAVAVGRCVDLGAGGLPYLPFTEAFSTLLGHQAAGPVLREVADERPALRGLVGLSQDLWSTDGSDHRLPLYDAVAAALRELGRRAGPLLIVLEDLHWADASTRDLLRFLLARLADERLLIVGTYRSDEMHRRHPLRPLLAELVRLPRVERIELGGFEPPELRDLLRTIAGAELPEWVVRDVSERSEGNAFHAEELLSALLDSGLLGRGPLGATTRAMPAGGSVAGFGHSGVRDRPPLPGGLADVLLARLERLPEQVQHVARVAAVAGRRVPDVLLRAALDRPDPEVDEALREAVAHHVLVADDADRYAFRHALVQEAVYADLLPGERVRTHARYARLLQAQRSADTAADLARHAEAAQLPAMALGAWLQAAREADRRFAPTEALSHYEQVLLLWGAVDAAALPDEVTLADLGLAAASAATRSGDHRRAVALATDAVEAARRLTAAGRDAAIEASARSRLAKHLWAADRESEALDQVQAVRRLLDGRGPEPARVWAGSVEARILGGYGQDRTVRREHADRVRVVVENSLDEARALDMLSGEAELLVSLAVTDGILFGGDAMVKRLSEALAVAEEDGDAATGLRARYYLASALLDEGRLDEARDQFLAGVAYAQRTGQASALFGLESRLLMAQTQVILGDWDAALEAVTVDLPPLPEPDRDFVVFPALPVLAARDPAEAVRRIEGLHAMEVDYPVSRHLLDSPRADALAWLGRPLEAVDVVEGVLRHNAASGWPRAIGGIQAAAIGLSALADAAALPPGAGPVDRGELLRRADHLRQVAVDIAERGPTRLHDMGPEGRAWTRRVEAEATRLTASGPAAGDVDAWRVALDAFRGFGHRYETARCAWRLALALLDAGERADAAALAQEARTVATQLGALPFRDAVDAAASRHRLDLGGGVPAPRVLTAREEQVLVLVAAGLTNREIGARLHISEKTASVHVSNLLAKLGASGRAEAVSTAHRRGLLPA